MQQDPRYTQVESLLRMTFAQELVLNGLTLAELDAFEKSPGEWVTRVDLAIEERLTRGLRALFPDAEILGEEACASWKESDFSKVEAEEVWLIDPLDGTKHFIKGELSFGIMLAHLHRGEVIASFLCLPDAQGKQAQIYFAAAGCRPQVEQRPVQMPAPPPLSSARGALHCSFLPPALKEQIQARSVGFVRDAAHDCAARRYADLLLGRSHYALYYRTLPWDHAPGSFLLQQAGGVARRFDGSAYYAMDGGHGLLCATSEELWQEIHARLWLAL